MAKILVTGGAGYIGSHTTHLLLERGHDVVVVDDLSKGYRHNVAPERLRVLATHDQTGLDALLQGAGFDAAIHFAAFIAVGESTQRPEVYYWNNAAGSLALFAALARAGVRHVVFSSTAAVYGNPETSPIAETARLQPVNPYGETKLAVERALHWLSECGRMRSVVLRYFNACGAAAEFGLGEEHVPETHLIPLVLQAVKGGPPVTVFGRDYPTPDGTCIRDYIHVLDLAAAHVAALDHLLGGGASEAFNVGTGHGHSVLEVLRAAERVTGSKVPHTIGPRREGDSASLVADSSKLQRMLGWRPAWTDLEAIIRSAWEFERRRS